jgi:CheY-like chemotaxis protein
VKVITATGGLEGVSMARTHRPDVIFMDVKMADLDGFAATRQLAAEEKTKGIPVIAVTASALGDTRKEARDAGCVAYLPKPVRAEALFAALNTHLGLTFTHETPGERDQNALTPMPRHAPMAARLREAVEIGAITDLLALGAKLESGDDADAALGRRITALSAGFDFDGLRDLATSLEALDRRGDGR